MSLEYKEEQWDLIIEPKSKWYHIPFKQIWEYRDLMFLMVRRDFVSLYKQTILGPLWFFIQPLFTTITFTLVFGKLAGISTDGVPSWVFYMAGITLWTYFANCLTRTSNTFIDNAGIFGKVYFPRMVVPLSVLITNLFKLGVQFFMFFIFWVYYLWRGNYHPQWNYFWLLPFLVILMAGMGLGFGILISSLTTKYRDLIFLVGFGVQLLMYLSPVVYPVSVVPDKYRIYILSNPLTPVIEAFKYIFFGAGYFTWQGLGYSFLFMIVLLWFALIVFHRVEKSFMDTV